MLYESKFQIHKISISDVAIAYRIPRSTVLKYINSGHLRLNNERLIDYYQLIEFLGEPNSDILDEKTRQLVNENKALKHRVFMLENMLEINKNIVQQEA